MELTGVAGVAGISVICYLCGLGVKATALDNKFISVICGVLGGALGALGLYIMPDFPASDLINAIAVGIASGLAATGADQIAKQLGGK